MERGSTQHTAHTATRDGQLGNCQVPGARVRGGARRLPAKAKAPKGPQNHAQNPRSRSHGSSFLLFRPSMLNAQCSMPVALPRGSGVVMRGALGPRVAGHGEADEPPKVAVRLGVVLGHEEKVEEERRGGREGHQRRPEAAPLRLRPPAVTATLATVRVRVRGPWLAGRRGVVGRGRGGCRRRRICGRSLPPARQIPGARANSR